jgi:hypothetical protein
MKASRKRSMTLRSFTFEFLVLQASEWVPQDMACGEGS